MFCCFLFGFVVLNIISRVLVILSRETRESISTPSSQKNIRKLYLFVYLFTLSSLYSISDGIMTTLRGGYNIRDSFTTGLR